MFIINEHKKYMNRGFDRVSVRACLNTELAKKPVECLEYIVVHEMVHILEPTHNDRFRNLLGQALPHWQTHRDKLNQLPVRHEAWGY